MLGLSIDRAAAHKSHLYILSLLLVLGATNVLVEVGLNQKMNITFFFFTDVLNELAETTTLCCPLLELTVIVFMVGLSVKR